MALELTVTASLRTSAPRSKISESVRVRTISPKLGPHNAKIFGCVGLDEVEVKNLRAKGVL